VVDNRMLMFCLDDPKIYDGAHVALQIVGRRLQEEKMLAIADMTTAALKTLL
jgi:amidase